MMQCQKCGAKSQRYLCNQCVHVLRKQLLSAPTLIEHLKDAAIGNTRLSSEQSRALGFESRTPIFNDKATELAGEIEITLSAWARAIARIHAYVISPPINWARPIDQYRHTAREHATFLGAHTDELAINEDVGELCASLRAYYARGLALINRPTPPQFCGPCPATVNNHRHCIPASDGGTCHNAPHECAARIMSPRGAIEVTCGSCGAVHRVERLVTELLARADHFRGTVAELYRVLRMLGEAVPMSTLYRWAEPKSKRGGSGQLAPSGYLRADKKTISLSRHSPQDDPLYRVSDARKVRVNWKAKGSKTK